LILLISSRRFAPHARLADSPWASHFFAKLRLFFDFLHLSFSQLQSPSLISPQQASTEADLMASIRVQGGGGSPQCAGSFQSCPPSCSFHPSLFAPFRQYRTAALGQAIPLGCPVPKRRCLLCSVRFDLNTQLKSRLSPSFYSRSLRVYSYIAYSYTPRTSRPSSTASRLLPFSHPFLLFISNVQRQWRLKSIQSDVTWSWTHSDLFVSLRDLRGRKARSVKGAESLTVFSQAVWCATGEDHEELDIR